MRRETASSGEAPRSGTCRGLSPRGAYGAWWHSGDKCLVGRSLPLGRPVDAGRLRAGPVQNPLEERLWVFHKYSPQVSLSTRVYVNWVACIPGCKNYPLWGCSRGLWRGGQARGLWGLREMSSLTRRVGVESGRKVVHPHPSPLPAGEGEEDGLGSPSYGRGKRERETGEGEGRGKWEREMGEREGRAVQAAWAVRSDQPANSPAISRFSPILSRGTGPQSYPRARVFQRCDSRSLENPARIAAQILPPNRLVAGENPVAKKAEVTIDRRAAAVAKSERRGEDRRKQSVPIENDRRVGPRREKVARRRQIDPTTCERDYSADEIEFMHAMDAYKRANGRMFPTCSEILEVIRALGYVRTTPVHTGDGTATDDVTPLNAPVAEETVG